MQADKGFQTASMACDMITRFENKIRTDGKMSTALLVIDVQNALLAAQPYQAETMLSNIQALLHAARSRHYPVIFIQHEGAAGTPFEPHSEGWQIAEAVAPLPTEPVFGKRFNSAFRETPLQAYLQDLQITHLVIAGMQTEYCIETTVRVGFEFGYRITLPADANSTLDHGEWTAEMLHRHHNIDVMDKRFATVCSTEAALSCFE